MIKKVLRNSLLILLLNPITLFGNDKQEAIRQSSRALVKTPLIQKFGDDLKDVVESYGVNGEVLTILNISSQIIINNKISTYSIPSWRLRHQEYTLRFDVRFDLDTKGYDYTLQAFWPF